MIFVETAPATSSEWSSTGRAVATCVRAVLSDVVWSGIMCSGHLKYLSKEAFHNLTTYLFSCFIRYKKEKGGEHKKLLKGQGNVC